MRTVSVYVEDDVGLAFDHGTAAWVFDLDLWGVCGQGPDEPSALADLRRRVPNDVDLAVAERIEGDEQAFLRDHQPSTAQERQITMAILAETRPQTLHLVGSNSDRLLDWDDASRVLPSFARWRTLRQIAWHIADTESRYYLPMVGLGYRERAANLLTELRDSFAHVRKTLASMPKDMLREVDGQTWTSAKVLRRLAWHERGELAVMRSLHDRGTRTLSRTDGTLCT
ncbi:DinB family protein [Rhizocola hellebori]|uniref:DinB family protein n=1 Tax=Rhizocola hellebori TaxID=1392758 RepID=UPI0019459305|nr:hypothetical protein [Rhizocola hellebori]